MNKIILAIEIAGGVSKLANKLGVKPPTVSQWKSGVRPVPPRLAIAIEHLTDGRVTCRDLRPDIWPPEEV